MPHWRHLAQTRFPAHLVPRSRERCSRAASSRSRRTAALSCPHAQNRRRNTFRQGVLSLFAKTKATSCRKCRVLPKVGGPRSGPLLGAQCSRRDGSRARSGFPARQREIHIRMIDCRSRFGRPDQPGIGFVKRDLTMPGNAKTSNPRRHRSACCLARSSPRHRAGGGKQYPGRGFSQDFFPLKLSCS
jgi:hypothetical protein